MRVAGWCCTNNLLINADNTKFLQIGTHQNILQKLHEDKFLFFLGKLITPVTTAKDLSVKLDCNLTYDDHINKLTASCMSKLCQINRVKAGKQALNVGEYFRIVPGQRRKKNRGLRKKINLHFSFLSTKRYAVNISLHNCYLI